MGLGWERIPGRDGTAGSRLLRRSRGRAAGSWSPPELGLTPCLVRLVNHAATRKTDDMGLCHGSSSGALIYPRCAAYCRPPTLANETVVSARRRGALGAPVPDGGNPYRQASRCPLMWHGALTGEPTWKPANMPARADHRPGGMEIAGWRAGEWSSNTKTTNPKAWKGPQNSHWCLRAARRLGAIWFGTGQSDWRRAGGTEAVCSMYPMYGRCRMVVLHRPGVVDSNNTRSSVSLRSPPAPGAGPSLRIRTEPLLRGIPPGL